MSWLKDNTECFIVGLLSSIASIVVTYYWQGFYWKYIASPSYKAEDDAEKDFVIVRGKIDAKQSARLITHLLGRFPPNSENYSSYYEDLKRNYFNWGQFLGVTCSTPYQSMVSSGKTLTESTSQFEDKTTTTGWKPL